MAGKTNRWKGFTILELLVTLFVISILAAIAIPAFFRQPEITLENASVLLAHDLRAAQNRSAYMAEPCYFEFTADGQGYRVTDPNGDVILNPATGLPFVRQYSEDAVFDGVEVLLVEAGGDRVMEYDERGRARESARITLGYEGDSRIVVVEGGKGTVTIVGTTSGYVDQGY